ncbi:hypothetical protein, partial [Burkholderia pseudomallei]|uniref:hypothetical protein n=1 Tax=Burkholderia pseudomallei TaxID=28450 RepID=UPI0030E7739C
MNLDYFTLTRRLVLAASLAASLGGCMSSTPVWDGRFGDSVRAVMQAQIIDPHAAEHARSAPGVDGRGGGGGGGGGGR